MDFLELGQFVKHARKARGVRQQQMADDLGLARATLSGFESGRTADIGLRKVLKMLEYLHYEVTPQAVSRLPTFESLLAERDDV
ncbi:helix-turn-helix transcriptional regulator [Marinomonas sp. M1K-6]|uniref:Helix-turn-helix transcriptional regulator n=1 Tax=Marinomonas profundi TaxID=2726122 RepID=A0A847R593_9GAMM|nr:helix-turn-helix transcriptional regulator [Marinomonas profundi]NLQ19191.1 helix-turn-helix transcriptional regulator [Marinomonas profundi]UDV04164.1 helix-turn-helix transcriptional regulator [Marinomonas profundi]